jgi:N-acetylmuramoyl-L-alanine amidase
MTNLTYTQERIARTDTHQITTSNSPDCKMVLTNLKEASELTDFKSYYWEKWGYKLIAIQNFSYSQRALNGNPAMMLGGMIEGGGLLTAPFMTNSNFATLVITKDGNMHVTELNTFDSIMEAFPNIESAGQAGDILVADGKAYIPKDPFPTGKYKHPRSIVGQLANGDRWQMVTDGRGSNDAGFTRAALIQIALDAGCVVAFMLDGGGSGALWLLDIVDDKLKKLNTNEDRNTWSVLLTYVKQFEIKISNLRSYVVANDVGHHEDTWELTGGKGVVGFEEFHFNNAVGLYLSAELKRHGITEILGQNFGAVKEVGINDRVDVYNDNRCDIVVSSHADYSTNRDVNGHCVYYWGTSTNGKKLAMLVDKYADLLLPSADRNLRECSLKQYNFGIVRDTNMPAVLAEWAFFSNSGDVALLKSDMYRRLCAEVYMRAICDFFAIDYIYEDTTSPIIETIDWKIKYDELKKSILALVSN